MFRCEGHNQGHDTHSGKTIRGMARTLQKKRVRETRESHDKHLREPFHSHDGNAARDRTMQWLPHACQLTLQSLQSFADWLQLGSDRSVKR